MPFERLMPPSSHRDLETAIADGWAARAELTPQSRGAVPEAVREALNLLDRGALRVAEPRADGWHTHQWLKQAILLSFRLTPARPQRGGADGSLWWDKVPPKFAQWQAKDFRAAQLRVAPGAMVRHSAYIAPDCVLMPSFINLGAHVGRGALIDTWATVGSCAQIGERVHLSGGAGIGGVLEPLQANPVIVENDCFIGARSEVAEGVIVREGAVLAMGVFLSASTKIVDRASGRITRGEVPPYAVVVPGSLPDDSGRLALACAVIVKQVDAQTRAKTSINELLRS